MKRMQIQRPASRHGHLRLGLRLEYVTVGWNLLEGFISIAAAVAAGSVVLLGFGIDSFVESASGGVLIWRLLAERRAVQVAWCSHRDGPSRKTSPVAAAKVPDSALFGVCPG